MSLSDYTNQTWSFHAGQWTRLSPTVSPPARNSESMVWDPQANELLMFGGQNESGPLNDTWAFTGTTWVKLTTSGAPNPRWGAGLAYFPPLHQVVLFSGNGAPNYDVYTYASGTWTTYAATSPNPGQTVGLNDMTYDYGDNYVLMTQETLAYGNYTWALNLTSSGPPPPLHVTASAMPQSGTVPLQVDFTSEISGGTPPYTVTWDFNDSTANTSGSPSVAGNTSHTYAKTGTFNAVLEVVDSASNEAHQNWTISVTPPALTLSILATPSQVKVNATVTFTATPGGGTPPYTYSWTFDDGGTSAVQDPTHAYSTAGTYTAELVLHDSAGASVSKTVQVTVSKTVTLTNNTSTNWWIYAVVAVVVIIVVAFLVLLLARRRKRESSPAPSTGPAPPPGPPSG